MENEIWKDIPGYEELYQASTFGNIKSYPNKGNGYKGRILKGGKDKFGYRSVCLFIKGVSKTFLVHRLVGITFLGLLEYKGRMCVCHKDDNPGNNSMNNLFLGTDKDNSDDMIRKKRHYFQGKFGKEHNRSKTVYQYSKNSELIDTHYSTLEAERKTNIDSGNIRKCCLGTAKTAGGYKWSYLNNNL